MTEKHFKMSIARTKTTGIILEKELSTDEVYNELMRLKKENKELKEQNQRLSEQKHIYKQDWEHLCIDKELLDSENEQLKSDNRLLYSRNTDLKRKNELYDAENEQLKQRCKELRNNLIDHSALINMLEEAKWLSIEDIIWNIMGYKTQTEFDDDFAHYREKAKRKWRE